MFCISNAQFTTFHAFSRSSLVFMTSRASGKGLLLGCVCDRVESEAFNSVSFSCEDGSVSCLTVGGGWVDVERAVDTLANEVGLLGSILVFV